MITVPLVLVLILSFGACAEEPSLEGDLQIPSLPWADPAAPPLEEDVAVPEAEPEPADPAPDAGVPIESPLERTDADTLFDAATIPVFEVELPEEDWQWLQKNAILEEYVEAVLTYEGEDMGTVGLRFRGSVGSLTVCFDEQGNLDTDYCAKLAMKLKFDFLDEDKRFFGMKRLNFNSMIRDPTKMAENISYGLFREMGVPTSRTGWAVLKVNGVSQGLFALVEEIDGRFTDDRWPGDGDGNLYKEVWPQNSSEAYYVGGFDLNDETATHEQMVAFADAMQSAAPEDLLDVLDEWTDLDHLYNYMAANDAVMNWDGVTSWGGGGGDFGPHNFFWYQHETSNQFTLIPWDLDNTMQPRQPWLLQHYVPHWTLPPDDCDSVYPSFTHGGEVAAPGCFPFFQALASDHDRYAAAVQRLLDGPFDIDTLRSQIDEYAALIRFEVSQDSSLSGVTAWQTAVEQLKSDLELFTQKLEAHRDRIAVTPVALYPGRVNDFEDMSTLSLLLGIFPGDYEGSTVSLSLNDEAPLSGTQDILMEFPASYGDWGQPNRIRIVMESGFQNLSKYGGIRLRLQADGARTVRIDLEKDPYDWGAKYGWDVEVSSTPTLVTLLFDDATTSSGTAAWAPPPAAIEIVLLKVWALGITPGSGAGSLRIDDIEFLP